MLRALITAAVSLLILLLLALWRLEAVGGQADALATQLQGMRSTLEENNRQLVAAGDRFTLLDQTISGLRGDLELNDRQLRDRLAKLQTITRQKGDTDESWKCLDAPVPAGLDQWLRDSQPGAAGGDRLPERVPAGQPTGAVPRAAVDGWNVPRTWSLERSPWELPARLQRAIVTSSGLPGRVEAA